MTGEHKERAHSKFSASGTDRWLNCAASVELEEASPPSKDSPWSKEGTLAHEVLETMLNGAAPIRDNFGVTQEMVGHCERAARKIKGIQAAFGGVLLVEKRVWATFIHPEMFGTCDAIIAGNDGTLHIIDFKYGAGHVVQAEHNTQLLQYALSAAESYNWKFDRVKMWILQPRCGDNWFKSWVITIEELQEKWLPLWHKGVARVLKGGTPPIAGAWCHWCRAKASCPAKNETRDRNLTSVFETNPLPKETNGLKEKSKEKGYPKGFRPEGHKESKIKESEAESFY